MTCSGVLRIQAYTNDFCLGMALPNMVDQRRNDDLIPKISSVIMAPNADTKGRMIVLH